MSQRGQKRKRPSLQDTPIDISKARMALKHVQALKLDLDEVEETEEILDSISKHVHAIEVLLEGAKKRKVPFSAVTEDDLGSIGVRSGKFIFDLDKVAHLVSQQTESVQKEIEDLFIRIKKIYKHVNMDFETGSRFILDAVLITLAEICSTETTGIAILSETRVDEGQEVRIVHPTTGFELWLTGKADYVVLEYQDAINHKGYLLEPDSPRMGAIDIAHGNFFLVEAKRQSSDPNLSKYIPEAVSQAIATIKSSKHQLKEVRSCLSIGQTWIFLVVKIEDETLRYHITTPRRLSRATLEAPDSLLKLREIVQLTAEWLRPTASDIFVLTED